MYKVLLVDDEPYVLEGLKLLVDWESRGFAVCGEASDGEDALEAIAQCRPDLVVTDIRMPAMSGLDLMRLARQQFADYEPQFIVLSGYGEFQYANAAMKYNAADYLLKPINAIEFDRALAKLSGVLAKQDAERNDSPLAGLAADRFSLGALIQGMQAPYQDRQTAQKLGISERTDVCVVLADANPNCSDALQQAIAQWEPIAAGVRLLAFDAGGSRFGAVVAGKPVRQAAFLSAMHRQLSGCMHEPLSLFASDWSKGFADLRKLYEQAAYMRDNYPFGSVSLTENVYTAPRRAMPEGASVVYPVCDYSSLYRLIDEGEAAAIPAAVDHIFAELHREGAAASVVRAAISDLSISLLRRYPPPTAAVKDHGHGPPGSADPVLGTGLRELRSILVRQCAAAAGMLR